MNNFVLSIWAKRIDGKKVHDTKHKTLIVSILHWAYYSELICCKKQTSIIPMVCPESRCRLNVFTIDNVDLIISAALMVFWYIYIYWLPEGCVCSLDERYCPLPYCFASQCCKSARHDCFFAYHQILIHTDNWNAFKERDPQNKKVFFHRTP